jgi:thiosulfate/3-mercaptopyruvate sulfurtransferase
MDRASGDGLPAPGRFTPRLRSELVVDTAGIEKVRLNPGWRVGDARAYERYQGKNETIDRIAGRIPGAISTPYQDNLTPEGFFRSPAALCAAYTQKLQTTPPEKTVFYCGSGVTSIHNILAMQVAGLGEARLYPGSWSEWIVDPARPIATG